MTDQNTGIKTDITFSDDSAYGSTRWVALRLGRTEDWFYRNSECLQKQGFPVRDPATKLWIKEDVITWIHSRRTIRDTVEYHQQRGVNLDGL